LFDKHRLQEADKLVAATAVFQRGFFQLIFSLEFVRACLTLQIIQSGQKHNQTHPSGSLALDH
jgi:hypothetical protein